MPRQRSSHGCCSPPGDVLRMAIPSGQFGMPVWISWVACYSRSLGLWRWPADLIGRKSSASNYSHRRAGPQTTRATETSRPRRSKVDMPPTKEAPTGGPKLRQAGRFVMAAGAVIVAGYVFAVIKCECGLLSLGDALREMLPWHVIQYFLLVPFLLMAGEAVLVGWRNSSLAA